MARKTATFLTCDGIGCNVSVEVEELNVAPDGWFKLYSASDGRYQRDSWEFHSAKCVARWARERAQITDHRPTIVSANGDAPSAVTIEEMLREWFTASPGESFVSPQLQEVTGKGQSSVDTVLRKLVEQGFITADGRAFPRRYQLAR